jgi:lipopolysaccharide export LptBFGC system permease protein LptF
MIVSIFGILLVTAGLMIFPGNQLIPTLLAQEDSMAESTLGNTTESTLGNTTESSEDEKIQGQGTISRKH